MFFLIEVFLQCLFQQISNVSSVQCLLGPPTRMSVIKTGSGVCSLSVLSLTGSMGCARRMCPSNLVLRLWSVSSMVSIVLSSDSFVFLSIVSCFVLFMLEVEHLVGFVAYAFVCVFTFNEGMFNAEDGS